MEDSCAAPAQQQSQIFKGSSFALYALSRGKGVPESAQEAIQQTREILHKAEQQGKILRIVQTRIGLEGETRLCVEFSDEKIARDFYTQIHQLINNVDLVNLVVEKCPE